MPTQASQKRWKQILQTIYEAIEDHGYPPTVREIGKSVGLSSSSTVAAYLEKLLAAGLIPKIRLNRGLLKSRQQGLILLGFRHKESLLSERLLQGFPLRRLKILMIIFLSLTIFRIPPMNCLCFGSKAVR